MDKTIDEIIASLNEQESKLRYLAEKEDKPGLSPILLDISLQLCGVAYNLKIIEDSKDGKED